MDIFFPRDFAQGLLEFFPGTFLCFPGNYSPGKTPAKSQGVLIEKVLNVPGRFAGTFVVFANKSWFP